MAVAADCGKAMRQLICERCPRCGRDRIVGKHCNHCGAPRYGKSHIGQAGVCILGALLAATISTAHAQVPGPPLDATTSFVCTVPCTTPVIATSGYSQVSLVLTGTGSGLAFTFEGTNNNGTTWNALPAVVPATPGTFVTSGSANGNWLIPSASWQRVRVNLASIGGGSATFALAASVGTNISLNDGSGGGGLSILVESGASAKISAMSALNTATLAGTEVAPWVQAAGNVSWALSSLYTVVAAISNFLPSNPLNAPAASAAAGTDVSWVAGDGDGVGTGGNITIGSGLGGATANGGYVQLLSQNGGATSGDGGAFNIYTGSATNGNGGNFGLFGGAGGTTTGNGGSIGITSGTATTDGTGGNFTIQTGSGAGAHGGGSFNVTAGDGGLSNGAGGAMAFGSGAGKGEADGGLISFTAGASGAGATGAGGPIVIYAGNSLATDGGGGGIGMVAGTAAGTGAGGSVAVQGGAGSGTTGSLGGNITIAAGNGAGGDSDGGNAGLRGGTATGTGFAGWVSIQGGTAGDPGSTGGSITIQAGTGTTAGQILLPTLPTSDPAVSTALWADNGLVVFSGSTAASSFAASNLSGLPVADPGGGKPWLNGGVLQVGP